MHIKYSPPSWRFIHSQGIIFNSSLNNYQLLTLSEYPPKVRVLSSNREILTLTMLKIAHLKSQGSSNINVCHDRRE